MWKGELLYEIKMGTQQVGVSLIELGRNSLALGVFLDKAQNLLKNPPLTDADRLLRFNYTVRDALSKGLTSLHDAGFDPASLRFFKRYGN